MGPMHVVTGYTDSAKGLDAHVQWPMPMHGGLVAGMLCAWMVWVGS